MHDKDSEEIAAVPATRLDHYVVGVGASAGGLEALERFFQGCPVDTGATFVVVQHLSPDHKSMMGDLLGRHTRMPVIMVEDDMGLAPDHVYLIPPGAVMHATHGHLHLRPKNPRGLTLPIDIFFSSLADVYGPFAIGIILSGTGTDGTRGATAINAAGGLVLAQDPESAKFDGMPRSAIATGIIDAVLPAEELARRVLSHLHRQPIGSLSAPPGLMPSSPLTTEEAYASILALLEQVGGIDFHDYKPATLLRRMERRMQVRSAADLGAYLGILEFDRNEILTLRREILISVTSFFRDPETFEVLRELVIAPLVAGKNAQETIRVWSAGVATGEEVYTLGMLFLEEFERQRRWPNLKIFATDVEVRSVEMASMGQYPESAAAELTPERLERFFTKSGNNFAVKNDLRQSVVFARHNLLADPPFTRMDLVVCRNVLIYFNPVAQHRALRSLQYGMNPEGYMLLGSSESLSGNGEGMRVLNAHHKLFQRVGPAAWVDRGPATPQLRSVTGRFGLTRRPPRLADNLVIDTATTTLLARFVPPAILVNGAHEAVHMFGDVQKYIRIRPGSASLELNRILPDPLVPIASALLYKAARDNTALLSDLVHLRLEDGAERFLRLHAQPLELQGEERFLLLCIEEHELPGGGQGAAAVDVDSTTLERVTILERELGATRESLQATIEELETSNEELQATNEELMSSNEELQSSNEELQSVNEELNTVNAEFQEKLLAINRINADMDSMARAAGVATVFVDAELHLTRFSPDAVSIFKVREGDLGRRLDDFAPQLRYPDLMDDLETTMRTGRPHERQVTSLDGRKFYLARILPYAVPSSTLRGAVATFVDVTAFRDAERLQRIIDALPEHVALVEPDGTIALVNAAWRRFALANGDPELTSSGPGANYLRACQPTHPIDGEMAAKAAFGLKCVLEGSLQAFSMEYPCHSPTEKRWFVMNAAPITGPGFGAVVSHVNVTARASREES